MEDCIKNKCTFKDQKVCNFIKNHTLARVFSSEFCDIFKNTFFSRTPMVAASEGFF